MGEIADMIVTGEMCETCGVIFGDTPPGTPRRCDACKDWGMPLPPKCIYPPWSDEQIAALEAWQRNDRVHEYTCGNDHEGDRVLIPTREGWRCPGRDYRQLWAWEV